MQRTLRVLTFHLISGLSVSSNGLQCGRGKDSGCEQQHAESLQHRRCPH